MADMDGVTGQALPGGTGLVLSGQVHSVCDGARLHGKLALVAGLTEVFAVLQHFDDVVVLRPLGVGLGIDWKLFQDYQGKTPHRRRHHDKYQQLAAKHLDRAISKVHRLTGVLTAKPARESGPFCIEERTRGWHKQTPIKAQTIEEAKVIARHWVERMRQKGWKCGEESNVRGTIQRQTERTVAWLCQRDGANKWLSIEYAHVCDAPELACAEKEQDSRRPRSLSAAQLAAIPELPDFDGRFMALTCGLCFADSNAMVLSTDATWTCDCGHVNEVPQKSMQPLHQYPDYGLSLEAVYDGLRQFFGTYKVQDVIPAELQSGFLSGFSFATKTQVFGHFGPHRSFPADGDSRCVQVANALRKLRAVYGRDFLSSLPLNYGIMDGVDFLTNLMNVYPYELAIALALEVLNVRFACVASIEAVFWSGDDNRARCTGEERPVEMSADGRILTHGEVYVYGCREGLRYALDVAGRIAPQVRRTESHDHYLALPKVLQLLGSFADEQRHFVDKVLPGAQKEFADRPSFYNVSLLGHGWSAAKDVMNRAAEDGSSGYKSTVQLAAIILPNPARRAEMVRLIRRSGVTYHIFRLGFGDSALRPKSDNGVFDRSLDPSQVSVSDLEEIFRLHEVRGDTAYSTEKWFEAAR